MKRSNEYMPRILKHEGGFVNHPRDGSLEPVTKQVVVE